MTKTDGNSATPISMAPAPILDETIPVRDEYAPQRPNDYEEWRELIEMEKEAGTVPVVDKTATSTALSGGWKVVSDDPTGEKDDDDGEDDDFVDPFASLPVTGFGADEDAVEPKSTEESSATPRKAAVNLHVSGEDAFAARAHIKAEKPEAVPPPSIPAPVATTVPIGPPRKSRVVLLKNLVGPGEVDSELQAETAEVQLLLPQFIKIVPSEVPHVLVAHNRSVKSMVLCSSAQCFSVRRPQYQSMRLCEFLLNLPHNFMLGKVSQPILSLCPTYPIAPPPSA